MNTNEWNPNYPSGRTEMSHDARFTSAWRMVVQTWQDTTKDEPIDLEEWVNNEIEAILEDHKALVDYETAFFLAYLLQVSTHLMQLEIEQNRSAK